MKTKLFSLLIVLALCLVSCGKNSIAEEDQSGKTDEPYKIVAPTQAEIDGIEERLNPILSMCWFDYDCNTDSIYAHLFYGNQLTYVYPEYEDEVTKYISEPLSYTSYGNFPLWYVLVNENDPLGYYPEIPLDGYDEDGNLNELLLSEVERRTNKSVIMGYNKYSGAYIDWLVEGVWNGKLNHEIQIGCNITTGYYFEGCYYHDGFYYLPEFLGDRGGGIMCSPIIESITPISGGKYELKYTVIDDGDRPVYDVTSIIALKESQDGFRFWSIYSIDTEWIETDFSYVG